MEVHINITPMSLNKGVLGLPIDCCRNWDASTAKSGIFIYANQASEVTFSPKYITYTGGQSLSATAKAWQFTVNNSVQFAHLKLDGVYTYAEERVSGEKLICEIRTISNGKIELEVKDVEKKPATNATNKLKALLAQGIRPISSGKSDAPLWNEPSAWIDFKEIDSYKDVRDCLYLWHGKKDAESTTYLYVGIVGATASKGQSKRSLYNRLNEEARKYLGEYGVQIQQFRYCSLNNAFDFPIPELLKTIEMSEITIMTSLFPCKNARKNIAALFGNGKSDVVLLNSSTSYKYVT